MSKKSGYDIMAVLTHLIEMLEPITLSEGIRIYFKEKPKSLYIDQDSAALITGLTDLLFKLIKLTPAGNEIFITVARKKKTAESSFTITIANTGSNLSRVTELNNHLHPEIRKLPSEIEGTLIEIDFQIEDREVTVNEVARVVQVPPMPAFYAEVRKRFALHFSKAEHLVATLANYNPRESAFLHKVNSMITENIGNPQMDANYISHSMNMSRTQLFRRLKPIIRQSPGSYIKGIKLQKAKELFETTDLRINEVAFKTGFESPSHFTKAFIRHFGVKPSLFCRNKMQQMSK